MLKKEYRQAKTS